MLLNEGVDEDRKQGHSLAPPANRKREVVKQVVFMLRVYIPD